MIDYLIDYRALLVKYIKHVGNCEGVDFISPIWKSNEFSDEEWTELNNLVEEAWN